MAEINPITATIWGPGAAFEEATARQAAEHHDSLVRHVRAHGRQVEVTGERITAAIANQTDSMVAAIQSDGVLTRALMAEGFDRLHEQAVKQTELLRAILKAVENPRRTQADELIRDGIAAFESGFQHGDTFWFDDAERDFREALETRRYAFMAHWFLGRIAFEVRENPDEAVEHFDAAARYSQDENPETSAMAHTWSSRILWGMGRFPEAATRARRGVTTAVDLPDAHFHLALAMVRIERDESSDSVVDSLATAIGIRPSYFYTAAAESALANDPAVRDFLDEDYRAVFHNASERAETLDRFIRDAEDTMATLRLGALREWGSFSDVHIYLDPAREALELLRRGLSGGRFDDITESLAETEHTVAESFGRAGEALRTAEGASSHLRVTDRLLGTSRALATAIASDVIYAVIGVVGLSLGTYPLGFLLLWPADSWEQAYGWSTGIAGLLILGGLVGLVLFGEVARVQRSKVIRKQRLAFERKWPPSGGN